MGINDQVVMAHNLKWGWMLHKGRETFYDEDNAMRCWETREEARQWAIENLGVDPIKENSTPTMFTKYEEGQQTRDEATRRKTDFTDLPLFSEPIEVEFPEIDVSKMLRFNDKTDASNR